MKSGFTLVELLVVVVIVFLVALFLFPRVTCGPGRSSPDSKCRRIQQQIAAGLLQYKDDHDQLFPSEADFKGGNPFWLGGGIANKPGTLDRGRPLAQYIRDQAIFECPRDAGTSAFDNPMHCYTDWGTSYLWAAKDIPEVGITGMLGRKYTDPLLAASSLKIMTFEPILCVTNRPLPKKDQWHGRGPRGLASFLDGHAEMVNQAPPQPEPLTREGLEQVIRDKRPYY
jgi:prepilin-type N-terminal cleavage/methylation domain-containing protein